MCKNCDGTGWILIKKEDGSTVARRCECYYQELTGLIIETSRIPSGYINKTVSEYQGESAAAKEIKQNVAKYVKCFGEMQSKGTGIYLYSTEKGTGKTHLACATGIAIIKMYQTIVKFITLSDLFREVKNSYNSGITEDIVDKYRKTPLLILDDIGNEKVTEWSDNTLYDIVDYREKNVLPTIFTSNCKVEDLKYGDRIKSRIKGHSIEMQAPNIDRRKFGNI